MQLHHITVERCPHCGIAPRTESINGQHANGRYFESRTFPCGLSLEYVPNYSHGDALQTRWLCEEDPIVAARRKTRHALFVKLMKLLEAAGEADSYASYLRTEADRTRDSNLQRP